MTCRNNSSDDFFTIVRNRATCGHSYKLFLPESRVDCRKRFFAVRVVRVWNSLPDDVVSVYSLPLFVGRLRSVDLGGFIVVGCSAFLWLLLSHTAWNSKESGAAAAVEVSIAICRYGSCSCQRVLAALWTAVCGGSSGGEFQTAHWGYVLISVLHSSCVIF